MKTFQEQKQFFDSHWAGLKEAVESGGADAALEFIRAFRDDRERRVLFVFARQGLVMQDWQGKNFDDYIPVADAGIAEMVAASEATLRKESRKGRLVGAHVISYNLAADLATCWPGDDAPRSPAHHERGLKAAEDCLGWCDPANVQAVSQDWWAKGIHQLALGDATGAATSWARSLAFAEQAAAAQKQPATLTPEGAWGVLLGHGYAGLARWIAGEGDGREQYERALGAFRAQLQDEQKRADAQFGIDQLEKTRSLYQCGD